MKITRFARVEMPDHRDESFDDLLLGRREFEQDSRAAVRKAGVQAGNVEQALETAQNFYFRGDYLEGLRHCARVLSRDVERIKAWVGQVRILIDLGRYDSALYWADKACTKQGGSTLTSFAKALALAHVGRIDDAKTIINIPVGKDDDPMIWLLRGEVLIKVRINFLQKIFTPHKGIGRLGAFFCFIKALASDQRDPFINQRIGLAYMLERQYRRAAEHLGISLNAVSDNALTLYGLAECYRARRDYERALQYVKKAITRNPNLDCAFELLEWLHGPNRRFYWAARRRTRKEVS